MTTKSPNSRIGTPVDRAPKAPTNARSGPASQRTRSWVATAAIIAIVLAVVTAALTVTHTPAQAQSAVLISNTGQTAHSSGTVLTTTTAKLAQGFTLLASASTAGYTVDSIGIAFHTIGDTSTVDDDLTVTLNANSSSGSPGNVLCTLSNPSTFSASGVHTFDATTTGTACPLLTQNKTYFAVIERANNNTDTISLNTTASTDEDSGGATGWSISNIRKWYTTAWGTTSGESHQIEITGHEGPPNNSATGVPTITGTPRVDETLTAATSGIEDDDGLTNQNFSYRWIRFDGTDETVITGAASSTYTLTNADAGQQIRVKVSFNDDLGNAEGPTPSELTETILAADVLVSNTAQTPNSALVLNSTLPRHAQGFITGESPTGYRLNSIGLALNLSDTSTAGADLQVTLNEKNNSNQPGDALCTLTDPATFTSGAVNEFEAPSTCPTLTKETTYFVVTERVDTTGANTISVAKTDSDAEDSGSTPNWSIDDVGFGGSATAWAKTVLYGDAFQVQVKGIVYSEHSTTVSNTAQTPNSALVLNSTLPRHAQGFITGENPAGYRLNSIGLALNLSDTSTAGADLQVTLNEKNSSNQPGDTLCTLTDPATFTSGAVNEFEAPDTCPTLTKETTYFVVTERVDTSGSNTISVAKTDSDAEDSRSTPNWSIDDVGFGGSATAWAKTVLYGDAFQIEVKGTAVANNIATGAPTITGMPQVGEVLSADTSAIKDDDGLTSPDYTYKWIRIDGMTQTDIDGATNSTYTITDDDAGSQIKVEVTFTDDLLNPEGPLSSLLTDPVNTPATGAPSITGVLEQNEELTADTVGIADADGLGNFFYQWIADGTDISGATSSTYTLTPSEVGDAISLRVTFTDTAGNAESLTSASTPRDVVASGATRRLLWLTTMTPRTLPGGAIGYFLEDQDASLIPSSFTHNSTTYAVNQLQTSTHLYMLIAPALGVQEQAQWFLDTGIEWPIADGTISPFGTGTDVIWEVPPGDITWAAGTPVVVSLIERINNLATGAPTITGTEQAGELLNSNTSAIQDSDGLTNVSYTYQWLRGDTEITGAVGPQYIPSDADVGNIIKVRVTFTDDENNYEQLTSIATATITAAASGSVVWSATLKVGDLGDLGIALGYLPEGNADFEHDGELTPPNFTRNGTLYTFLSTTLSDTPDNPTKVRISPNLTRDDMESWTIIFREKEFRLSDSLRLTQNQASGFDDFSIHRSGLSWTNDEYVAVALNIGSVVNNPRLDLVLDNVSQGGRFITVKPHMTNTSDFGYGPDYDYTGSSISSGSTFFTGQTHEETGTIYGYTYEHIEVTSTGDLKLRLSVNALEGSTVPLPTTSHFKLNLDGEAFDLGEATVTHPSVTDTSTHLLFVWPSSGLTWVDDQQVVVFVQEDEIPITPPPIDPPPTETMTGGICSRSQAVQAAIIQKLGSGVNCSDVTPDRIRDLTSLHIYDREIESLKAGDLAGFTSLDSLNISGANLQSIESGALTPVNHSLRHVLFAHNDLEISDLSGLTSDLKTLSLGHNNIGSLGANAFSRFTQLEKLNLEGNPITSLHADAFDGLTSLNGLHLGGHNPPYSSGTGKRRLILNADQFEDNRSLQVLDLSNSRIGTIPNNAFNNLGSLRSLVLKDNNLTSITRNTFHADLGSLRSLSLGCNNLTTSSFANNWSDGVDTLRDLYLHNNNLDEINSRVFSSSNLPRLKFLSLENNPNLEIFNASVLQGHSHQLEILMFGNEVMELIFVDGPPPGWPNNVQVDFHSDVRSCGDYNASQPTFRVGDAVASESGNGADSTMTFSVNLQYGDADPHSVEYHTEAGTATGGSDYTATSGTLSFGPDEYSKTVLVTVRDDNFEDSGETFRLVLTNPTGGAQIHGNAGSATGTILNHDQPGVEATFPQTSQTSTLHTGEEDHPQVIVAFSQEVATFGTLTPSVQVTGGTLTSVTTQDLDGIENAWLLVLSPSGVSNISLEIIPNQACDNGGICTTEGIPVTAVPAALTIPGPDQATTTNPLTASFANVPTDHDGSTSFTFTLSFSENVEAGYTRIRDHAFTITGGDIDNATRVTQGSNQSWTVHVDPDDNGAISITLPQTTDCDATGAICTDDDRKLSHPTSATVAGPPAISVSDASVQEADGAVLTFTATLSHASSNTITVGYATSDGTATAGSDYTAASGTLTFRPGHPSQTIQVPVLTDSEDEDPETMTLTLSNPMGSVLADAEATGTISDSEAVAETEETTHNTEPTGLPTISGTPQVDHKLTASISGIGDAEGLTNPGFTYQWVAGSTDISGATNSTYFLTSNEQGKTVQVRVSFTDDAENVETLTSIATEAVAARSGNTVWEADMSVVKYTDTSIGAASADLFSNIGGTGDLQIRSLWSSIPDRDLRLAFTAGVTGTDDMTLHVGDLALEFPEGSSGNGSFKWTQIDVDWEDGETITVRIDTMSPSTEEETEEPTSNTLAAGLPTISGTPQVDQTLTADTSGISDADGLANVSYQYQWIAGGLDINGATASSYLLTANEQGQTVQVKVTFTDDADNQESLTSAETLAVAAKPNTAATGEPTISGTPQVDETLTAGTSAISDEDGLDNVSYQYQWLRDDADIAGQTNSTYDLVSADEGKTIRVRVTFRDDADNAESLISAATTAVAARPTPAVLLTASFANVPADHNGNNFIFQLSFSENVEAGYARIRDHAFTVDGATIDSASRITQGSNQGWNVEVNPTGNEAITITLPETNNCSDDEAICTDDERMLSHSTEERVEGPPAISVSDATVQEAEGATLEFSVTLSHASSRTVTVSYATSDGTAQAGSDYTATSATLTFNAGDLSQTVDVTVLTDSEDEGQETLTLTLSNPSQATLGDGNGTGTIENGESSSGTQEDPPAEDPPVVLLTASFDNMPATHNGSEFTFDLAFSEDFPLSYVTLRDDAFTVDGGNVENAQRKVPGSNQTWTITVKPDGNGAVSITLPETADCNATGAICTDDERKLSNSTPASIAGPQ